MRGVNPGKYRHRVDIEERVEERDPDTGAVSVTWQPMFYRVPAEVLTGPGREMMAADAKHAETAARINLPWFPGLNPKSRVLWEQGVYDITSVETDATGRREYRLRCKDGLSDGQ